MSDLQVFNNNEFGKLQAVYLNGETWFIVKDICEALGLQSAAISQFGVDETDIKKTYIPILSNNYTLVNESGLYTLILRSNKPEARRFRKWVTSEVLPSIRKTGGFNIPQTLPEALRLAADLAEENGRLAIENKAKDQIIGELKPKADYTDRILQSQGVVPITAIAKDYGMSGMGFNNLLHKLGVQYRLGEMWLLYSKYQNHGYTHSKTFDYRDRQNRPQTRMQTEWTQKGRLFLYNLLKNNNILPLIEQGAA